MPSIVFEQHDRRIASDGRTPHRRVFESAVATPTTNRPNGSAEILLAAIDAAMGCGARGRGVEAPMAPRSGGRVGIGLSTDDRGYVCDMKSRLVRCGGEPS